MHARYNFGEMKKFALFSFFAAMAMSLCATSVVALNHTVPIHEAYGLNNEKTSHILHDDEEDVDYRDDVPVLMDRGHLPDLTTWYGVYSDEIFFADSTKYHHLLAKQSIGMALSAFFFSTGEGGEDKESTRQGAIGQYLADIDFDDIRIDDYEKETSIWTIGSAIGRKTVTKGEEKADVVAVAIRGGNYQKEWQSNLTLGIGFRHEGFDYAASLVTDRVLSYIAQLEFQNPIKIWITGFSRAGAVANLVAANLIESPRFNKNQIYAYTYAAPAPVWYVYEHRAVPFDIVEDFNSVHNIIGASDFIPQFVPREWNYMRYGVDHMLPGAEFDLGFDAKYAVIQKKLGELGAATYYNPELNLRVRLLYGLLEELADDEFMFTKLLQPLFLKILQDASPNTVLELMRQIIGAFNMDEVTASKKDALINYALTLMVPILTGTDFMEGKMPTLTARPLIVAHEHFPDVYFLWLYSFKADELFVTVPRFDYVLVTNGEFTLVDLASGKDIYTVKNGVKTLSEFAIENKLDAPVYTIHGQTVLTIPHDRDLELRYALATGEEMEATTIPYDRFYRSELWAHTLKKGGISPRKGTLIHCEGGEAVYEGYVGAITPSNIIAKLSIDKLGISYHGYILLFGLALGVIVALVIMVLVLLYRKISRTKMRWGRFGLVALSIAAIVYGELAFWFSPDLIWINMICKAVAAVCFLVLYFLHKPVIEMRFMHRTLLPFLLLFLAANIVVSVSIPVGLGLYILAGSYLCYYNLRQKKLPAYLWTVFAVLAAFTLGLGFALVQPIGLESVFYLLLIPETILCAFTCILHNGQHRAACYLYLVALLMIGLYFFVPSIAVLCSLLYVLSVNASLLLFTIDLASEKKDDANKTDMLDEIEEAALVAGIDSTVM